jgi:alkanesulfonate monooxygenase SsuD/methylene tetrahydromethanopterin reductase-like flavin-dependent oxidoreductase (luciferase family)
MAMTFGLHALPRDASDRTSGDAVLDGYRRVTDLLGPEFTTLWVSDHLDEREDPILECWTTITYLAATFPRFRVGSLVLGQGYRNPALLAKMAATLQFLTGGRLVLGLGAGWHEAEYGSYGFRFPSPRDRVDQLIEVVQILRQLWDGGPATFAGKHYSIVDAYCRPVPTSAIPVLIGSDGTRMVRFAAEHADAWNWDASPDLFDRPFTALRTRLEEVGRPLADIEITAGFDVDFPADPSTFVGRYPSTYPGYDQVVFGPTPDDAVTALQNLAVQGVGHVQLAVSDMRTLDLFAREVAPAMATDSE